MLSFERQVVASLIGSADEQQRIAIERFVETSLAAMPEHLRAGVLAETIGLGAWARLRGASAEDVLRSLERSPIGLLRQYERLFGSLVLFAEQELASPGYPA